MNNKAKIVMRFSLDGELKEYTPKEAGIVLSNMVSMSIKFTQSGQSTEGENQNEYKIHLNDLLMIQDNVFRPEVDKEFFELNGIYYRNIFVPSKLIQINKKPKQAPIAIFYLISNLVNGDEARFIYFINWLAAFFQSLTKSQIAILFKGEQGAGKGILFDVIALLFGKQYCKQVNGDSLGSRFFGSFLENTVFLNFDEISYQTIDKKSFNSFLKAVITNGEVTAEKKNINMDKPIKIYAQTILFSNADIPIEIEQSDRRFTVFTTAGNLANSDFLNYGSYENFKEAIMSELEDFAMYLKLFNVDIKQANTALFTQEKSLMIDNTKNNLQWFADALINRNFQFFQPLQQINITLYNMFIQQLVKGRIYQKHIIMVYIHLYPNDKNIKSSRTIIKHLESIYPAVFGEHNIGKSNGGKYYKIFLEVPEDDYPMSIPRYPVRSIV